MKRKKREEKPGGKRRVLPHLEKESAAQKMDTTCNVEKKKNITVAAGNETPPAESISRV